MLHLAPSLANLEELQLGFNEIATLSLDSQSEEEEEDKELMKGEKKREGILGNLKVLNLDSNRLSNFEEVCRAVRSFASYVFFSPFFFLQKPNARIETL